MEERIQRRSGLKNGPLETASVIVPLLKEIARDDVGLELCMVVL